MRATRIVIPKNVRATVLTIGHEGHLGVVSMKQRLRTKVGWPKLEKDVEKFVRTCDGCQLVSRPDPPPRALDKYRVTRRTLESCGSRLSGTCTLR